MRLVQFLSWEGIRTKKIKQCDQTLLFRVVGGASGYETTLIQDININNMQSGLEML